MRLLTGPDPGSVPYASSRTRHSDGRTDERNITGSHDYHDTETSPTTNHRRQSKQPKVLIHDRMACVIFASMINEVCSPRFQSSRVGIKKASLSSAQRPGRKPFPWRSAGATLLSTPTGCDTGRDVITRICHHGEASFTLDARRDASIAEPSSCARPGRNLVDLASPVPNS